MTDLPLLTILIALPLVAAAIALFVNANGARWIALVATLADLALGAYLWAAYDPNGAQWQFVEKKHAAVCKRDFAWARDRAAAKKRCIA